MKSFFESLSYQQLIELKFELELCLLQKKPSETASHIDKMMELSEKELKEILKKYEKQAEQVKNNEEFRMLQKQMEEIRIVIKVKKEKDYYF